MPRVWNRTRCRCLGFVPPQVARCETKGRQPPGPLHGPRRSVLAATSFLAWTRWRRRTRLGRCSLPRRRPSGSGPWLLSLGCAVLGLQLLKRRGSVKLGHPEVQQHDIRFQPLGRLDAAVAVFQPVTICTVLSLHRTVRSPARIGALSSATRTRTGSVSFRGIGSSPSRDEAALRNPARSSAAWCVPRSSSRWIPTVP